MQRTAGSQGRPRAGTTAAASALVAGTAYVWVYSRAGVLACGDLSRRGGWVVRGRRLFCLNPHVPWPRLSCRLLLKAVRAAANFQSAFDSSWPVALYCYTYYYVSSTSCLQLQRRDDGFALLHLNHRPNNDHFLGTGKFGRHFSGKQNSFRPC
jgi:hypothetical protein